MNLNMIKPKTIDHLHLVYCMYHKRLQKSVSNYVQITHLPQKEFFLENWLISLLSTYWALSSYNISNKSLELIKH